MSNSILSAHMKNELFAARRGDQANTALRCVLAQVVSLHRGCVEDIMPDLKRELSECGFGDLSITVKMMEDIFQIEAGK